VIVNDSNFDDMVKCMIDCDFNRLMSWLLNSL